MSAPAETATRATATRHVGEFLGGPLAGALLLITPFVSYAHHHAYSLYSTEILVCIATLGLGGACLGVLVSMSRGIVQGLVIAVTITLAIDLSVKGESFAVIYGTFAAACVVTRLFQQHIKVLVASMCLAAMSANAFVQSSEALSSEESNDPLVRTDLPPVVHLILDEYISVDALPRHIGEDVRDETIDFFTRDGFKLVGGAYSQYSATYNSIGNALNFASSNIDGSFYLEAEEPFALRSNAYFEALAQKGYRMRVYQTSYIDYCDVPGIWYGSCSTYASASIKYVEDEDLPSEQKARFIFVDFWRLSEVRRQLRQAYNNAIASVDWLGSILPHWGYRPTTFGSLAALEVFDRLSEDITRSPGGEVFFAHMLIPHASYLLDEHCVVRSDFGQWQSRLVNEQEPNRLRTAKSRDITYQGYVGQLRCVNRLLSDFFAALKTSGQFDRATIIVHGDHGSRINLNRTHKFNADQLVESDFTDAFPTLFAFKRSGTEAGYVAERATLSALLAETVGANGPAETDVFLSDGWGKAMLPQPMPESWMAHPRSSEERDHNVCTGS